MKKLVLSHLTVILLLTLIIPVHASVELKATIGQDIYVIFNFQNVTAYETIKEDRLIDEFTIPEIIRGNLEEQNLTNVEFRWEPVNFNDAERSICVRFYLSGSDILTFTFSTETMRRTCRVRTNWRKFELNLTDDFYLNFTEYFGTPLSDPEWNFDDKTYPTYYYNYTGTILLDPVCYFILPREATDIHVQGESLVFELPPSLGDSLLNSPFLILGAIIVANIVAFLYRTIKK